VRFFDPTSETEIRRGSLPHWRQDGAVYFVTFRTKDSLPSDKIATWTRERDQWLREHPPPRTAAANLEFWERFPRRLHRWLDQGQGRCLLRDPIIKAIVESSMRHFDGERYTLDEFVIAANHVHVLVETRPSHPLGSILRSWKAYSAMAINRHLGQRGSFWQRESFDHIVRSERSLERFREYIRGHDEPTA